MSRKTDLKTSAAASAEDLRVHDAKGLGKPLRRAFPGPPNAAARLRVAVDAGAYADLITHARESLKAEVCGILAGAVCEDEAGPFTHVQAVIRGSAASSGTTHVTFTQEAWTAIHETLEREHPKLRIVGWYHTHPGFGVEFSDMDLFIQRNFFGGPGQIALVTDPLSGAVGLITQLEDGAALYLPRFWVDGRDCAAQVPESSARHPAGSPQTGSGAAPANAADLEARLAQLTQSVDELRTWLGRFLFTAIMLVCLGVVCVVALFIHDQFRARNEPPQLNSFVPVPVKMGDKNVLLGVSVVSWDVPPELNALLLDLEKQKQDEAAKAAQKTAGAPAAPPSGQPAPSPEPPASKP